MMTKDEFLNRVKDRAEIGTMFAAERTGRAVLMTLKEALQSEDIEEEISEKLSPELRRMFENPAVELFKVPKTLRFTEDDVIEEGHEPEEVAIKVLEKIKDVKL